MNEVKAHKIDADGYYVEDVFVDPSNVPDDVIIEGWNIPLAKPQWQNGQWVDGKSQNDLIAYLRPIKIDELKAKCAEAIQSGFTSSALGTAHTYAADATSMIYWNATVHRFLTDSTFTSVNWATVDAGFLVHTKDQFMQAFHEGHQFGIDQEAHLAQLLSDVANATTVDALDAITW